VSPEFKLVMFNIAGRHSAKKLNLTTLISGRSQFGSQPARKIGCGTAGELPDLRGSVCIQPNLAQRLHQNVIYQVANGNHPAPVCWEPFHSILAQSSFPWE
jgi:hypothetical protein